MGSFLDNYGVAVRTGHHCAMEAAEAIARHLKLRDIGGQVVIDFIEMRDKKHVLEVEKTLRTAMKNDRARHDVARMSSFGLLELVRQRTGSSALAISLEPCPACGGTGMCKVATRADIEAQGWSLNPGRYVGVADQGADDFDFAERLEALSEELELLNAEAHLLEEQISANFSEVLRG